MSVNLKKGGRLSLTKERPGLNALCSCGGDLFTQL